MNVLSSTLTILSAICAGAVMGYIFGFVRSAHFDVMSGVRPRTNNRFLIFICPPTASYNFAEGLVFLFLMLAWIPIFFGLCSVPVIVGSKLGLGIPFVKMTYVGYFAAMLTFLRYGAKAWSALV
jgi:hypothetical protein